MTAFPSGNSRALEVFAFDLPHRVRAAATLLGPENHNFRTRLSCFFLSLQRFTVRRGNPYRLMRHDLSSTRKVGTMEAHPI